MGLWCSFLTIVWQFIDSLITEWISKIIVGYSTLCVMVIQFNVCMWLWKNTFRPWFQCKTETGPLLLHIISWWNLKMPPVAPICCKGQERNTKPYIDIKNKENLFTLAWHTVVEYHSNEYHHFCLVFFCYKVLCLIYNRCCFNGQK